MRYRTCVNDHNYTIILEDIYHEPDTPFVVEVGYDRYKARILSWNRDFGVGALSLDDVPYDIEVMRDDRGQMEKIKVDGVLYTIQELQAGKLLTKRAATSTVKEGVMRAFMPGLIVKIEKKEGDMVTEGETVLFMEAMKMQNAILAPCNGRLARIPVKEGATVLTSDLLFVVEGAEA